jgi:hypothetical protein
LGIRVQGWIADDASTAEDEFVSIKCTACSQMHLVNLATGRVLGAKEPNAGD